MYLLKKAQTNNWDFERRDENAIPVITYKRLLAIEQPFEKLVVARTRFELVSPP
jgi:hypothetical protein